MLLYYKGEGARFQWPMPISVPTNLRHALAKALASNSSGIPFGVNFSLLPLEPTSTRFALARGEDGGAASAIIHADGVLRGIDTISHRIG